MPESSPQRTYSDDPTAERTRNSITVFWAISGSILALTAAVGAYIIWSNQSGSADPSLAASARDDASHSLPQADALASIEPSGADNEIEVSNTRPAVIDQDVPPTHANLQEDGEEDAPEQPAPQDAAAVAENDSTDEALPIDDPVADPVVPALPEIVELHDLNDAVASAGFNRMDVETVTHFVRFGNAERAINALTAGQFTEIEMEREAEGHRHELESRTYLIRDLPITVPDRDDFEQRGLIVTCDTPVKLWTGQGPAEFGGNLFDIWLNQADPYDYWYLTKFETLRHCRDLTEVAVVEQNDGILYHPESFASTVFMQFNVELDAAKVVYENPTQYSVDLIVEGLKYGKLATGQLFFHRDVLLNNVWNCDDMQRLFRIGIVGDPAAPHVWEGTDRVPMVRAQLISATLRDASGRPFGQFRKDSPSREFVRWMEPGNMGRVINSDDHDASPFVTQDGEVLLFESTRPGGRGQKDIWMSERDSMSVPWQRPVNLGATINSQWNEGAPCISHDGLTLFFHSDNRPGALGSYDIWMSSRPDHESEWGEPVSLGMPVNSEGAEQFPSISPDGLTLYFSSGRPGGFGLADLWMATRSTRDSDWDEPINLGPDVNTADSESAPEISADGLTLFFAGFTNGSGSPHVLWMARRSSSDEQFGDRTRLGGPLNNWATSGSPTVNDDNRYLIFHSNHAGSRGWDLWWTERNP